jgi:endoglucanase
MKRLIALLMVFTFFTVCLIPQQNVSAATNHNYADAFAKSILFYEANWCGADAGDNRLEWRGPCHVGDGSDIGLDLSGGFHDCGDHVKFGLPQMYTAASLGWSYYEFKDIFSAKGQDKYMLSILKHFTDYIIKCFPNDTTFYYQVGDGDTDHAYWGPPEMQKTTRPTYYTATPQNPGSDVAGDGAAALALMYMNYKDKDSVYAAKCLDTAKRLYKFGQKYRGSSKGQSFYTPGPYYDELMWGAVWLYIATNDTSYMSDIEALMVEKGIGGDNMYENRWTNCWDDVMAGVFCKLAQVTDKPKYKTIVEWNLNYWMNTLTKTPGGIKFLDSWGMLKYPAAESMIALTYNKTVNNQKYVDFAKGQLDYILGTNPVNMSYIVGYGDKYPQYPHHRAANGRLEGPPADEKKQMPFRHLLYGALVGGPDMTDQYVDDIESYRSTEVGLDYNAGLVGALAGITGIYGKDQVAGLTPDFAQTEPPYYMEAAISEENASHITIDSYMHNVTTLPPSYDKGLTFRYFVDLSEFYAKGVSADSVKVSIHYAPNNAKLTQLIPWDEANHIYYVEASWPNTELYGKTEVKFDLSYYTTSILNTSNDFSHTGMGKTMLKTEYIPIYKNGVKVYGKEPSHPTQDLLGDVNGDTEVNALDFALMKSYLIGNINDFPIVNDMEIADVNGDNSIDALDFALLKQYILGKIIKFPIQQ